MSTDTNIETNKHPSGDRFTSSAVWFCVQASVTAWLALAGIVVGRNDFVAGLLFASGFVVANLWGLYLWRCGEHASIYVNLQRLLGGIALVVTVVTVSVNWRASSLVWPYWPIVVYLGGMLWARLVLKPILAAAQSRV